MAEYLLVWKASVGVSVLLLGVYLIGVSVLLLGVLDVADYSCCCVGW